MSRRVQPKRETKGKKAPRPTKKARAELSNALECQTDEFPSDVSGLCAHCHVLPSKVVFLCDICDGFTCTESGRCMISLMRSDPTKCVVPGCARRVMCGGLAHPKGNGMRCGGDRGRCVIVYCWEHAKQRACKLCGVPQCVPCSTMSSIRCDTCVRIRTFRPDLKHPEEPDNDVPAPPSAVAAAH